MQQNGDDHISKSKNFPAATGLYLSPMYFHVLLGHFEDSGEGFFPLERC
jgi:hypothetical protein